MALIASLIQNVPHKSIDGRFSRSRVYSPRIGRRRHFCLEQVQIAVEHMQRPGIGAMYSLFPSIRNRIRRSKRSKMCQVQGGRVVANLAGYGSCANQFCAMFGIMQSHDVPVRRPFSLYCQRYFGCILRRLGYTKCYARAIRRRSLDRTVRVNPWNAGCLSVAAVH